MPVRLSLGIRIDWPGDGNDDRVFDFENPDFILNDGTTIGSKSVQVPVISAFVCANRFAPKPKRKRTIAANKFKELER